MQVYCPKCGEHLNVPNIPAVITPIVEREFFCPICYTTWTITFSYKKEKTDEPE